MYGILGSGVRSYTCSSSLSVCVCQDLFDSIQLDLCCMALRYWNVCVQNEGLLSEVNAVAHVTVAAD